MVSKSDSLVDAVLNEDGGQVATLIEQGAPLEEEDHRGQTALVLAAATDQFRIAEQLIEAGADPFAADDFGWTAGYAAQTSNLQRGPEFEAKQRVKALLEARGFPFPSPDTDQVKTMVAEGKWPPRQAGQ